MSATPRADLLLHPVRLRILQAFMGCEQRTAGELAEQLADVPQASLYRHLGTLTAGGLLRVAAERRVRGTVERVYELPRKGLLLTADDLATAGPEDHLRYFVTFAAALVGEFGRYLRRCRGRVDVVADGIGYRERVLHLRDEEYADFVDRLRALIEEAAAVEPAPGRRKRLITTVLFPLEDGDDCEERPG